MEPTVAIILLNYNGEKDTIECLNSLKKIDYKNYFIIIVDNHSNQESIETLRNSKSTFAFQLLESKTNNGFAAGNNIGIRAALEQRADYIVLLNNDTLVEKDFLSKLLKPFEEDKDCGVTTSTIYYEENRKKIWCAGGEFNPRTFKVTLIGYGKKRDCVTDKIKEITFATGCCMCIKREVFEQVGCLNEKYFMYEEDSEFCYRVIYAGWKLYYAPEAVIYHKISASTGGKAEKASALTQYYMVRNKMIFIREYAKGFNKLRSYIYNITMYIYYCFKGYMDLKFVIKGIGDFLAGIRGKRDE